MTINNPEEVLHSHRCMSVRTLDTLVGYISSLALQVFFFSCCLPCSHTHTRLCVEMVPDNDFMEANLQNCYVTFPVKTSDIAFLWSLYVRCVDYNLGIELFEQLKSVFDLGAVLKDVAPCRVVRYKLTDVSEALPASIIRTNLILKVI